MATGSAPSKAPDIAIRSTRSDDASTWPFASWPGSPVGFWGERHVGDFMDFAFSRWPAPNWMPELGQLPGMGVWAVRTDIDESDEYFVVSMEVPGLGPEDLTLTIEGDRLVVEGEKSREQSNKSSRFEHVERHYGRFRRVIALPPSFAAGQPSAVLDKGVLTISFEPPLPAAAKSKAVNVAAA